MSVRSLLVEEALDMMRRDNRWTAVKAVTRLVLFNDNYERYVNSLSKFGRQALIESIETASKGASV